MRSRRSAREDLRLAVECLPRHTREAMLTGVRANTIIVGAYVDRRGGVCPMLAAHRNGGRPRLANLPRPSARYTRARGRPRPATGHALNTLSPQLHARIALHDLPHFEAAARRANTRVH